MKNTRWHIGSSALLILTCYSRNVTPSGHETKGVSGSVTLPVPASETPWNITVNPYIYFRVPYCNDDVDGKSWKKTYTNQS